MANDYTVGRGKVYFDKFDVDGALTGERYIGNTPSLSENSSYQMLDHYNSDEGVREKDDSVQLQNDRNLTIACDNVVMENVAIMFGTDVVEETATSASGQNETFTITLDRFYQLGTGVAPDGVGNVSNVVVTDDTGLHAYGSATFSANPAAADTITINGQLITFRASAPGLHEVLIGDNLLITAQSLITEVNAYPDVYDVTAAGTENVVSFHAIVNGTAGNSITLAEASTALTVSGANLSGGAAAGVVSTANYEVDLVNGRIHFLSDAPDIATGDIVEIDYDRGVSIRSTVIDGQTQIEGALRYIANNPKGTNKNRYYPRVKLTPSGEYALKGETWQTMTFNAEVLKPVDGVTNRAYVRQAS